MKKNEKEKKYFYLVFGVLLIGVLGIVVYKISNSYAIDSGNNTFGTLSIECDSDTVISGNTMTCRVKGKVSPNSEVSCLSAEIELSENLTLTKFTKANNWLGSIDEQGNQVDENSDGNIYLYSDENSSGTFDIGTIEVTSASDIENALSTITLKNIYFYDENYEEKEISNASYNLQIISDYLEFDSSLNVDEDNKLISSIKGNTAIENIISKINTNGNITVLDKNNNEVNKNNYSNFIGTGYIIKITLSNNNIVTYKISVKGDINSDGEVDITDVVMAAEHSIDFKPITKPEYFKAGDINEDGEIDITDVVLIAESIVKGTEL